MYRSDVSYPRLVGPEKGLTLAMAVAFSTKAGTLANLQGNLRSARILPLSCFTVEEWRANRSDCLGRTVSALGDCPWIIRSSCRQEDTGTTSNAGAFLSLGDVTVDGFEDAVDRVVASYGEYDPRDQVLVQPMLQSVIRSGVAFTHDPNTCAPYRVVTWVEGDDTSLVTGGLGGRTWQQAARSRKRPPDEIAGVIDLLEELLELFGGEPTDCEFAVTRSSEGGEVLWLRRPDLSCLLAPRRPRGPDPAPFDDTGKDREGMRPHPFLIGRRTVYGVMPDWNPAEIVESDLAPRPVPVQGADHRLHLGLPASQLRLSQSSQLSVDAAFLRPALYRRKAILQFVHTRRP